MRRWLICSHKWFLFLFSALQRAQEFLGARCRAYDVLNASPPQRTPERAWLETCVICIIYLVADERSAAACANLCTFMTHRSRASGMKRSCEAVSATDAWFSARKQEN